MEKGNVSLGPLSRPFRLMQHPWEKQSFAPRSKTAQQAQQVLLPPAPALPGERIPHHRTKHCALPALCKGQPPPTHELPDFDPFPFAPRPHGSLGPSELGQGLEQKLQRRPVRGFNFASQTHVRIPARRCTAPATDRNAKCVDPIRNKGGLAQMHAQSFCH